MTGTERRILELRQKLLQAEHNYYVLNNPTISDAEFDQHLLELRRLETQHPEFADPNSPTARVGGRTVDGFAKVSHGVKMLSLDNAFTVEDIVKFFGASREVVMEPKIDGLSLGLRYENGRLVRAVTRGDGAEGDDVTENARTIKSVPLILSHPFTVEIRGEVYMSRSKFEELNRQCIADGEDPFKNPRNAAAGSMKQRDTAEVARRGLGFCAYRLIGQQHNDEMAMVRALEELGFETPRRIPMVGGNRYDGLWLIPVEDNWKDLVKEALERMDEARKSFEFDTDGAVLKINGREEQEELGDGNKYVNWGVAFKYPPERKSTRLKSVVLTVGRTGQITPNAVLEPLQLSGTTVKAANLCNQDEVERLKINVGDDVLVEKAGEIIPKVMGVGTKRTIGFWVFPENCPSCNSKLVRNGVHYFCPNHEKCPDQIFERLNHAVAKTALDIDGCGEAQIRSLMEAGCRKVSDLFLIPEPDSDWSRSGPMDEHGGVGQEIAEAPREFHSTHGSQFHVGCLKTAARKKFLLGREKAKAQALWRKLVALGIEGVGKTLCKELAVKYSSIALMVEAPKEELVRLLGPVNYNTFVQFIVTNADEIELLDSLGLKFEEDRTLAGALTGKTFCITGAMTTGTRDAVAQRIEMAGGIVKSSVGKSTQFLIVGEGGGNNKSRDAAKHGTKCITEEDLYKMLGQPMPVIVDPTEQVY